MTFLEPARALSPFYHYVASDPLRQGLALDHVAFLVLVALAAAGLAMHGLRATRSRSSISRLKRSENSNPVSTARRTGHDATTFLSRASCSSGDLTGELDLELESPRRRAMVVLHRDRHVPQVPIFGLRVLDERRRGARGERRGEQLVGRRALSSPPTRIGSSVVSL